MRKPTARPSSASEPILRVTAAQWGAWLADHHASTTGVRLLLSKQGKGARTLTYAEALEVALMWGWIDGQKWAHDDRSWLQRFTPRRPRSAWSKINREKAEALLRAGKMQPPGLREVERARQDGRWDAAYDSARTSQVPDDLARALARSKAAAAFFETLDGANRYAILYRLQTAKKPETRAARLARFVAMLASGETLHPPRRKRAAPAR
ncbi:MAG TPA: YdeI/OmpD-associated family protein [Kofleriaceae bacterium]|jgi:uncharacterized protein YdeI (YjbR/CyaY-like superfamily)|nr:YdeI/OmpD-associated family protein [Kofleriaceae bacterium]